MTHPWIRQEDFADINFVRVRRQASLLQLPHAEPEMAAVLEEAITLYDRMIVDDLKQNARKTAAERRS